MEQALILVIEEVPGGQVEHAVAAAFENVPFGQTLHVVTVDVLFKYVPPSHLVHTVAPTTPE